MSYVSRRRTSFVSVAAVFAALLVLVLPARARADGQIPEVVGGDQTRRLTDGHYELTLDDGHTLITHGGDPYDEMAGHGTNIGPGDPERDPVCATDYYQHVLYGYRTGSANRYSSVLAQIRSSMKRINHVLDEEGQSSGNKHADFKVKCDAGDVISVGQFSAGASDFDTIVNAARAAGYNLPNVDYTIFWDANLSGYCGIGSYYRDDSPGVNNLNNNGGSYGVTYYSCWDTRTPMHENGHNQGAVQRYAPDSTGLGGHCNDTYDVMCYAPDGGDQNQTEILTCVDRMHYDCGNDSYFDAQTEPGEWLETHWNIGSSVNRFIQFSTINPQPGASVSPASHAFGNQNVGVTSTPRTVTVTSNGQQNLVVGTASITGANASDFAIATDNCSGQTLAPGNGCTMSVTFTPASNGTKVATLSIPHNAPASPSTVAVSGTGVTPAPAVSLSPSTLAFGSRTTGTASPTQTSTVTNSGSAPLVIGTVTLGGANPSQFEITNQTCNGQTLSPGATCVVTARFVPSAGGSFSASVAITSNAAGSPHSITLTGTGVPPGPAITLSPTSLSFGSVAVGSTKDLLVTVTNTGTLDLHVATVSVAGSSTFSLVGEGCTGGPIAVNGSCQISVRFAPNTNGGFTGTLQLTSDAPGSPHSVPLSGTGGPAVTFSPSSLSFGNVEGGTQSVERTVTLMNNATSSLFVSSLSITGPFASAFTITTPGCTGTIPGGGSCSVGLKFRPSAIGGHTATLVFNSSPAMNYALSGTGVDSLPPVSTFTTQSGSILTVNRGVSFLTNNKVNGSSTDSASIVTQVVVTFTHATTGTQTVRTLNGSNLSCSGNTCTWAAIVPNTPGSYRVNAQATDGANPAHTESPGPTINVYAV